MVTENHAIYQNNQETSLKNKEVEPVEPVQKSIYQSNTNRKDFGWLHFDNESRVHERQQGKNQQPYISVDLSNNSKYQLRAPVQIWQKYSMHHHMLDLQRYWETSGERNFKEQIKGPIFLGQFYQ